MKGIEISIGQVFFFFSAYVEQGHAVQLSLVDALYRLVYARKRESVHSAKFLETSCKFVTAAQKMQRFGSNLHHVHDG